MNKLQEKIAFYNALIDEVKALQETDNIETIKNKMAEIETLKDEIEVLNKTRELQIIETLKNSEMKEKKGDKIGRIYDENVLKRMLRNKATAEDLEVYNAYTGQKEGTPSIGGYLVPETQLEELYLYKRSLTNLASYVNVVNVSTPKGSMPLEVLATDKLSDITEGEAIPMSSVNFGQTKWETHDFGDMMAVTNFLLDDTNYDLMGYLKTRIGKKSVNTSNAKIVELLKTLPNPITGAKATGLDTLDEAIIKGLDPVFRYDGIILTNQSGRLYLETLTDKQGRSLLSESYTKPGVKEFRGLILVEVSDELLPNEANNLTPFFIGDMKALITRFELKGLELAVSTEAGFTNNTTVLRAIERFDTKIIDNQAMKYVKITTK